nr:reverse transcriptase domain-containing protein [Tanacetum cinerariifolium]
MRTRSRSRSRNNSPQREASPAIVEPLRHELPFLEDQFQEDPPPRSPMADNRTMAKLLTHRVISSDVAKLKDMVKALLLDKKNQSPAPTPYTTPALVKAVELNYTNRALIDVHKRELTLRIGNEAITYNLDQTVRYSANYNQMTANKIDVVESACEEYSQEGINPEFCTHKILMEEDYKLTIKHQRRVNPKIYDVITKEVEKLLDAGLIYPIFDSLWVSPRLAGNEYYCFLDGFSGYFQILVDPRDQEKKTFTCPYAIFHDMVEKTMEVFMDDFSVFGNSFENCLSRLDKMLQRCEDTNLSLNWEKIHFMVKEGIVLVHKNSKNRIEVDRAKVDVIAKLSHPTTVKGIRSFLGHAGFYRRFIQDFSKISRPLTEALILIAPNWDLPFELMCDASDFAISAVLGQRQEKHFKPIHYASKIMNDAETNYTTTEKRDVGRSPPPEVPMADNRTMAELLQAPTEGYENAIIIPEIAANNFELKHGLINLVQNKQFFGHDKEDPHSKFRQSRAKEVVAKVGTSSSTPAVSSEVAELKDLVRALLLDKKNQSLAPVSSSTPAPVKARQNVQNQLANLTDMMSKFMSSNTASSSGSGTLPSNTITNLKEELKGITTRSGVAYQGPTNSAPSKVVKQGTEVTKDQVQTPSSQSTAPVQPLVSQSETPTPISEPIVAPVSASMPNVKSSIPYLSRRDNERRRDQANEQIKKFYKIFKDMSFEISFTDDLILMPKFASTLKTLIRNKEKLSEMARTLMNEHCLAVILNKLPRKLGDPEKNFIPCEFPGMDECLALADLADFMVVYFEPDPRVLLILGRCFLKTGRALIDVHKGELTLRIENEAITYNLDQTVRYSANYNQMKANKIDVICEEYSQEVLGFSDTTASGNPTPHDDIIVSTTFPTLTLFGDSDFLLFEEADAFLGLEDDSDLPKINPFYYDPEGDIL